MKGVLVRSILIFLNRPEAAALDVACNTIALLSWSRTSAYVVSP